MNPNALTADLLLILHFLFILFVVGGQLMLMIGYHARWTWTARPLLRISHIASVLFVVVQSWTWRICPLTTLENRFRIAAGQRPYDGSFIAHWLGKIIYYHAPWYVFAASYTAFGLLVLLYGFLYLKRRPPKPTERWPSA